MMYAENWRRHIGPDNIAAIDACAYFKAVESKDVGCYRCPLRCGKQWRILEGKFAGEEGHGYEVAYIMTLAITLGFRDMGEILHLANLINQKAFDINEFCGAVGMLNDAYVGLCGTTYRIGCLRPGYWRCVGASNQRCSRTARKPRRQIRLAYEGDALAGPFSAPVCIGLFPFPQRGRFSQGSSPPADAGYKQSDFQTFIRGHPQNREFQVPCR